MNFNCINLQEEILEEEEKIAIDDFNEKYDKKYAKLVNKMDRVKKDMIEKHERKLKEDMEYWDGLYPEKTNSSIILLLQ